MHFDALNLREVMVFLVAAGVVVPLVRRLRVSPVLGFLIVGLFIGPYGLARFSDEVPLLRYVVITDHAGVQALAELGVVFLLFMIGLELSLARLWAMRRMVFGLGGAQVVLTGVVIGGIAALFDNSAATAMVLGAGFALSSTAIVMQLLAENRRLSGPTGQTSFSILLFQDLAVLPILFLVAALGQEDGSSATVAFLWAIGQAALAVTIILVLGRLVIRPVFRFVGAAASREMFLALVLVVIIGTAMATQLAGLSMALGAFLAGLLFAETEYRHEVEVDIEPFRGLLLGLFFVSVGMGIDVTQVAGKPLWLVGSVLGLFLVKAAIIYGLVRLFGEPRPVAAECGLLLGQGGEFAFLVVGLASTLGLMTGEAAQFMLIVTGLTMLITPLVAYGARRLALRLEAREADHSAPTGVWPAELTGHFVIVGYGRVGQMLGAILESQSLTFIALDTDARLVARFQAAGQNVFYGDAGHPDLLRLVGAERSAGLVVTMDSPRSAEWVVDMAHRYWPKLPVYARACDVAHGRRLIARGARHVVPETLEASLQLAELVLMGAGIPDEAARTLIQDRRQAEQAAEDEG